MNKVEYFMDMIMSATSNGKPPTFATYLGAASVAHKDYGVDLFACVCYVIKVGRDLFNMKPEQSIDIAKSVFGVECNRISVRLYGNKTIYDIVDEIEIYASKAGSATYSERWYAGACAIIVAYVNDNMQDAVSCINLISDIDDVAEKTHLENPDKLIFYKKGVITFIAIQTFMVMELKNVKRNS